MELNNMKINLQQIIDSLEDGLLVVGCDHKIIYLNESLKKLFKLKKDHYLGKNISDIKNLYPINNCCNDPGFRKNITFKNK